MKLLYITQFFYPEITAGAFRAYEHAKIWAKEQSIDVTIYTGNPNYPKGELYNGYENKLIKKEALDGLTIIRGKSFIKRNTNKLGRIFVTVSFMCYGLINLMLNRSKLGEKFDGVLGSSGPIFTGVLAYIGAKVYKAKFIFEIRDITYTQMLATMNSNNLIGIKLIQCVELFLCKRADQIVVVTKGFKDELISKGINAEKISVIYNGINIHENVEAITKEQILRSVRQDKLVLTYAGTIGISQGIDELIDFFIQLPIENKQLNLIGEGAQKDFIGQYVKMYSTDNIKLFDAVNPAGLKEVFRDTDFAIVKLKYNEYFKNTIPSKVFDLLKRNIPILYLGPKGTVEDMIIESQTGIALTTLDNKKNVQLFIRFLQSESLIYGGYSFVKEHFNRKKLAMQYLDLIKEVIDKNEL